MITPLFTIPLEGEGGLTPLAPLDPGGERVVAAAAAADESASPAAPTPPSAPREAIDPPVRIASLPFSPSPSSPGLPVFGGVAARTGLEDAGRAFSPSAPRKGGVAARGEDGGGCVTAEEGAEEEEGCQRSWIDCSSSRHSEGFVRQKLRRPGVLLSAVLPLPLPLPLPTAAVDNFLDDQFGEKSGVKHRREAEARSNSAMSAVGILFRGRARAADKAVCR